MRRETHQVDLIHYIYLLSICEGNPWSKVVSIPSLQNEGEQLEKHSLLHTHPISQAVCKSSLGC